MNLFDRLQERYNKSLKDLDETAHNGELFLKDLPALDEEHVEVWLSNPYTFIRIDRTNQTLQEFLKGVKKIQVFFNLPDPKISYPIGYDNLPTLDATWVLHDKHIVIAFICSSSTGCKVLDKEETIVKTIKSLHPECEALIRETL